MEVLDHIQENYREIPRNDPRRIETDQRQRRSIEDNLTWRALRWLRTEQGQREVEKYDNEYILVSGEAVVGHGKTVKQAGQMMLKKGVSPHSVVLLNGYAHYRVN